MLRKDIHQAWEKNWKEGSKDHINENKICAIFIPVFLYKFFCMCKRDKLLLL